MSLTCQLYSLYKAVVSLNDLFHLSSHPQKVQEMLSYLTDRRTSGRFTADLQDFKFLFDSMPQVEAHRITILSLTVKRKKERKPQGNSQQDIMKEVTIRS